MEEHEDPPTGRLLQEYPSEGGEDATSADIIAIHGLGLHNEHFMVSRRPSPLFTGRQEELGKLKQALCSPLSKTNHTTIPKIYVIYGLRGSGKSEIALNFAFETRSNFWGVFWIDGRSESSITEGFTAIARICGHHDDGFEDAISLLENTSQSWLLIFQDANNIDMDLSRFLPKGEKGSILITTRFVESAMLQTVGKDHIQRLNSEVAIELFLKACKIELTSRGSYEYDARQVVEHLDCRPLAITLAGATILNGIHSLEEYKIKVVAMRKQFNQARIQTRTAEDLDFLSSLHLLADQYSTIGDSAKAIELLERIIYTRETLLSPEHPELLSLEHVIGPTYLRPELLSLQHNLGPTCLPPALLSLQHHLGPTYLRPQQAGQAINLPEEIVLPRTNIFGPENPNLLASLYELAQAYRENEETSKALALLEGIVKIRTSPEDPDILATRIELTREIADNVRMTQLGQPKYSHDQEPNINNEPAYAPEALGGTSAGDDEMSSGSSSYAESIRSTGSDESISSTYSVEELKSAAEELEELFANDEVLKPLYKTAFENRRIGVDRFLRNFPRLLKIYAMELRDDADGKLQKSAVRLVSTQAVYVTNSIRRRYDPDHNDKAKEMRSLASETSERARQWRVEQYLRGMLRPGDRESRPSGADDCILKCNCDPGLPAQYSQIKNNGISHGPGYYTCSKFKPEGCGLFFWDDETKSQEAPPGLIDDDDQDPENGDERMDLQNLTEVKHFLVRGSAFQNLRRDFQLFVQPPSRNKKVSTADAAKNVEVKRDEDEDSDEEISSAQDQPNESNSIGTGLHLHNSEVRKETLDKSKSAKDRLWDSISPSSFEDMYEQIRSNWSEYMEPPLEDNKTRIRWTCHCGERLWDDFVELRPGAAKDLQNELNFHARAGGKTASNLDAQDITSNTAQSSNISRMPSAVPSSGTGASAPATTPTGNIINSRSRLTPVGSVATREPSLNAQDSEKKFLLLCFSKMNDTRRLLQLSMEGITNDFKLFQLLQDTYSSHRNTLTRAYRTIVSINAIKLEHHPWERVVILSNSNEPELPLHENPEACHTNHSPKCDTLYDLHPTPPDLKPFMGKNDLAHLLKCPHEAQHQGNNLQPRTVWLNRFPKKEKTKLTECPPYQFGLGWGIEFEEGWHVGWLLKVVIILFVLAATVFLICWWKLKGDVQGATGMASALMSYATLLLAAFAAVIAMDVKQL